MVIQKREKEKQKEKEKEKKKRKKERVRREKRGREKKGIKRKMEDFLALQRSKLDGPSIKVGTRIAIYMWTPKTWSFDKLHKVGDFPTRFTLSLKAI